MREYTFPETGFVRLPQVLSVFPISRSGWYQGVADGKYPQPIKLGHISVWRVEDILKLIDDISTESRLSG